MTTVPKSLYKVFYERSSNRIFDVVTIFLGFVYFKTVLLWYNQVYSGHNWTSKRVDELYWTEASVGLETRTNQPL